MNVDICLHRLQSLSERTSRAGVGAQRIICSNREDQTEMEMYFKKIKKSRSAHRKSSFVTRPGWIKNSWSWGQWAWSEPLSWSMNETLRRDGAWRRGQVPYGGPIVEMDALIGVKCIRCLDRCQIHYPTRDSHNKLSHNSSTRFDSFFFLFACLKKRKANFQCLHHRHFYIWTE